MVNKTVYKPSEFAVKLGIVEDEVVDKKSGEMKAQIKLGESAQLFIIENYSTKIYKINHLCKNISDLLI